MDALQELLAEVRATRREIFEMRTVFEAQARGPLAPEDDFDDLLIRFDPSSWASHRGSWKGKRMSEAPPEFLDHLARALTQIAAKEDDEGKTYKGKPASQSTRRNAARARRWALRKRLGWTPPPKEEKADESLGGSLAGSLGGSLSTFGGSLATAAPPAFADEDDALEPPTPQQASAIDEDDELPF